MELDKVPQTYKSVVDRSDFTRSVNISNPFQIGCQQALIKKQRRAKNCLLQLDAIWHHNTDSKSTSRGQVGESTINGWIDLDSQQNDVVKCSASNADNKNASQTIRLKERSVTEASSLIPHLKEELSRLESPERRRKDRLSGTRLFNLQVMSQLNRKRKHSLKVQELIRNRQDRFLMTSNFKKIEMPKYEPFTNAQNRLNQNKCRLKKKIFATPVDARLVNQQPYHINLQLNFYNQNEIKHIIKPRPHSPKHLKTSKDFYLSKMDQARTSKSSFYIERKKDKLTLKNLLDI